MQGYKSVENVKILLTMKPECGLIDANRNVTLRGMTGSSLCGLTVAPKFFHFTAEDSIGMRAVKRINNNFVLCVSKDGKEFVARGKGIGFREFPYELSIRDVERTYYGVDPASYSLINEIEEVFLEIAASIVDQANRESSEPYAANVIFTLADHLSFAVERHRRAIMIRLPMVYDVAYLYEKEYNIGQYGLKLIGKRLGVWLPDEEAAYIALHLINSKFRQTSQELSDEETIAEITRVLEREYDLVIDSTDFNYSRFVSHMHYLLKRGRENTMIQSDNDAIFAATKESFPKAYQAAQSVCRYLLSVSGIDLSEEEQLYLMMHINRLCTREECYQ